MKVLTAVFVVLLSLAIPSFAWGPQGHRIVARIAEDHLTPDARRQIAVLLGNDDLESVSTWADDIRNQRPETYDWHFVDIPWNTTSGFSSPRDCYRPDPKHPSSLEDHHNCVVDRIVIFEHILADPSASRSDRAEALKFLVHFVADLHQPLHAIAEARGGNDIRVSEFGTNNCGSRPCNLHSTWDVGLIEHAGLSESEYAAQLEKLISQLNLTAPSHRSPEDWANESFHLTHQIWLPDGGVVDEEYYRQNVETLNRRLAFAGVRLAALLNEIFGRRNGRKD